jgi:signal transduction histidine kinase/CheY-like chemotaxis protein/AraC-like DNA-binding protein
MGAIIITGQKPKKCISRDRTGLFFLFASLLVLLQHSIFAQFQVETGYFPIINYDHQGYNAHHQNWFISRDQDGLVYAGNGEGVLEFDGVNWRLIRSPGLQAVRTVVVDKNNRKWVGADRELGYLAPDSLGTLQYNTLKDKVPVSHPLVGNIWQIFPEGNRILFVTDRTIYCWENNEFRIIPSPGKIYREFKIHEVVYFDISGQGMYELKGDTLILIPGGETFKGNGALVAVPFGPEKVLFVTHQSQMYIYDGKSVQKIESDLTSYLVTNKLYAARSLADTAFAFTTMRGGVVVMDRQGSMMEIIAEADGILNDQVYGLTTDQAGALWMATQTGISKVAMQLPYRNFDERSGLAGTVSAITRHQGALYVGTFEGLYRLFPKPKGQKAEFKRIKGIDTGCFALLSLGEDLFAATSSGTFRVGESSVEQLNRLGGCRYLYASPRYPGRVFVSHMHGVSSLVQNGIRWQQEEILEMVEDDIFSVAMDKSGKLWLDTSTKKIFEVDLNTQEPTIHVTHQGLPDGSTNLYLIKDDLYVVSSGAGGPLFKFDRGAATFQPEENLGQLFGLDSLTVYPLASQENGRHILLESLPREGKKYRFSAAMDDTGNYSAKRLYDEGFRSTTETRIYWDKNDVVWLGGEMITRYDLGNNYTFDAPYDTHIRKVTVGHDSMIYGGISSGYKSPELPFSTGSIRFEYAANSPGDPSENLYQYRLEGFEDQWSEWTNETRKDYTNLPEGTFTFRARAKTDYGTTGGSDAFGFTVLTPWYRSFLAFMLYILLFAALLWAFFQLRARQLLAKNEALERVVALRTAEVRHQANQLRIQAEKLQDLDKAKSRFFANISHEFRTPLTLIKNPIEHLEQHSDQSLSTETVKMIRRNANRLLQMVNQLLDLSKIDEGSLKLILTEGDIFKCLRAATSSFNSHAAQRNIDYKVQIPHEVLWASFDRDKLENIIYNLLGNAFKFCYDGASITILASFINGKLEIVVTDTGVGIPKEKLPRIFERFYQADDSSTRDKEGSGIGLSLSRDLAELMGGDISVISEMGEGATFTVVLPVEEIETGRRRGARQETVPESSQGTATFKLSGSDKRELPRILLVEDNADMRNFIRRQLLPYYLVSEAINGDSGLKKALKQPPDLIITDLMMPRMDGIELCRMLKSNLQTSHIPVIMLTAKAGRENKLEGLETGADDYLTKPFDGKELQVRIKNLIDQRQRLRELYSRREVGIDPGEITVTSVDQRFLERLLKLLEEEHSDPDFGVPEMQRSLAMSKTQLHRKLKALTNEAPGELLRNFRLKRAAQLLRQQDDSVTQIAYKVGFNNLSYFAKCFKELFGQSPSSY